MTKAECDPSHSAFLFYGRGGDAIFCSKGVYMKVLGLILAIGTVFLSTASYGENPYGFHGSGRLLTNDLLGDGHDRWRTSSYAYSYAWVRQKADLKAPVLGDVVEFRSGFELVAPSSLHAPTSRDRAWGGVASFGVHAPFTLGGIDTSLGVDINILGPQNGLTQVQTEFHGLISHNQPNDAVRASQITDQVILGPVAELAWPITVGHSDLRPFFEARHGAETLARIGMDLWLGAQSPFSVMSRDPVTGFRYGIGHAEIRDVAVGMILGADVTHVEQSALFPATHSAVMERTRFRARLGIMAQRWGVGIFSGVTWLSPEFTTQSRQGQWVGSLRFFANF